MDRRITLALVLLLALLGGYIWYTFLRTDAPPLQPQTPAPTAIPVLTFSPDKVSAVEVRDAKNNHTTRVVRDGKGWRMEQPARGPAASEPVDGLLFDLSGVTADRQFSNPTDLAGYGLNPPQYLVQLTFSDGTNSTFELGGQNPDKSYYYARPAGAATVYLIQADTGNTIHSFIESPPYTPTATPTEGPSPTPSVTPAASSTIVSTPTATPTP